MKLIVGALAVALLAGCASMNERRADGPSMTFTSKKDVAAVSDCVLFAWQNQSLAGAHYDVFTQPLPGGGRTVVTAGQIEFVDITSASNGSRVDLYFQSGLMDWRKDRRTEAVKTCL
jgi:hypothetical protein